MSDKKSVPYLDVVANTSKTAQAWKSATYIVGTVAVMLAAALVYQARNQPTVLIPYDYAANATGKSTPMKVTTNGEIRGTNAEYVANVAMADLGLILNITPDNVLTQYQRFLNRVTEDLYGSQREPLMGQAKDLKSRGITQSFYPMGVEVSKNGDMAEITGTQIRYMGGKEILRSNVTYILKYKVYKGFMHVSDLRQKTDAK